MKRITFFYLFTVVLFLACSKTEPEPKSYTYWNDLVNEKYEDIYTLTQSIPCTDIEEFEIIKRKGYYLVHPSVKAEFEKLQVELEQLESERNAARAREDWVGDLPPTIPSHPVRKICDNGKSKLIYVKDLSIEEINAELPVKYNEIQTFYEDVTCTDASQWVGRFILTDCDVEPVAIHKTIRNDQMIAKVDIYNQMMVVKMQNEPPKCGEPERFNKIFESETVKCEEGEPVVTVD